MEKSIKIAIITPGVLPVPTVKGGAVEMLTEYLLQHNEANTQYDITLYGVDDKLITPAMLTSYKHSRFNLINQQSLTSRIQRLLYTKLTRKFYYNYYMDYYAWQAIKKIKRSKADILLIENRSHFVLLARKLLNIPIVLHLHNDTLDKNTPDARSIMENVTKVLTVSNYIKKQVDTIAPTNKVHTVYNGIDLSRFTSAQTSDTQYTREAFKLSPTDFVAIFTGRLDPIKGIKELMQAMLLLKDYPQIKLLVVGGSNYGNSTENDFVKELRNMVNQLNDRVIFTGHLPYDAIPSILALADIGVIPSTCEDALTLSSLEDMAVGLPLVVTRSGGIPEAVDEECAIVVEKDERLPESLAENIRYLFENKEKRAQMAAHAKERAKLFGKEVYTEKVFKELTDIIE